MDYVPSYGKAARKLHEQLVLICSELISHGLDIEAPDSHERTPLMVAADAPRMRLLLEEGANVHARCEDRQTVLHMQVSHVWCPDVVEGVQLLVEHGAAVDARDRKRRTPLHCLVDFVARCIHEPIREHDEAVTRVQGFAEALVRHGASITVRAKDGRSPLDIVLEQVERDSLADAWNDIRKAYKTNRAMRVPAFQRYVGCWSGLARMMCRQATWERRRHALACYYGTGTGLRGMDVDASGSAAAGAQAAGGAGASAASRTS